MKKVSVVLTTYNAEKTIEQTLASIMNQQGVGELFNLEVLAVDDCSTDNTLDILKKYPVHVLTTGKNSGGPNRGRNLALLKATGDYICITDHDDVWKENRIIKLFPYLDKALIVSSGYTVLDKLNGRTFDRVAVSPQGFIVFPENATFRARLTKSLSGQNTYMGSLIYHSELKEIFFEEHFGMVDFDWILRLFKDRSSIEVCEPLYFRNVDGSNLSLNAWYRRCDFYYSLMNIEEYEAEYPAEVRMARRKIHGSRARYFYLIGDMKKARFYFRRSGISLKTIAYYVTTFVGSEYVKRKFNIFG